MFSRNALAGINLMMVRSYIIIFHLDLYMRFKNFIVRYSRNAKDFTQFVLVFPMTLCLKVEVKFCCAALNAFIIHVGGKTQIEFANFFQNKSFIICKSS